MNTDKKNYIVKKPFRNAGVRYAPGATVELTPGEANLPLRQGLVAAPAKSKPPAAKLPRKKPKAPEPATNPSNNNN